MSARRWSYRIVDRGGEGEAHEGFGIHEVYLEDGRATGFSIEPAEFSVFPQHPTGDGSPFDARAQLRDMLQRALAAIDEPIVVAAEAG